MGFFFLDFPLLPCFVSGTEANAEKDDAGEGQAKADASTEALDGAGEGGEAGAEAEAGEGDEAASQADGEEGAEEGDAAVEALPSRPMKKVANQFNFCDRAALTYNNPYRVSPRRSPRTGVPRYGVPDADAPLSPPCLTAHRH